VRKRPSGRIVVPSGLWVAKLVTAGGCRKTSDAGLAISEPLAIPAAAAAAIKRNRPAAPSYGEGGGYGKMAG